MACPITHPPVSSLTTEYVTECALVEAYWGRRVVSRLRVASPVEFQKIQLSSAPRFLSFFLSYVFFLCEHVLRVISSFHPRGRRHRNSSQQVE